MIKLPENLNNFNMTNKEFMALSNEDREILFDKLRKNIWEYYSEANPDIEKPQLPCVIDGVIIGE